MSADYNFDIKTPLSPKQVLEVAAKGVGTEVPEQLEPYAFRVLGAFAVASEVSELGRKLLLEEYGFAPTVGVTFEYYPSKDKEGGRHAISQGVAAMLREVKGDAVLFYNGEETMLQRIGGNLLLDKAWSERGWLAAELSAAGLKYEVQELASPLAA